MELRQLKTFQTVAHLMNFNRSAEVLNYAQSTVSAQIKLLEEELGVQLFDRLGKRIMITEAGQKLVRYAQKMLDMEKEARAEILEFEEPQGTLSIRAPQSVSTYLLPSVLCRFKDLYPKAGFDISSCAFYTLQHELRTGITDVAFLLTESINASDLSSEILRIEPLVMVSEPDHPLSKKAAVSIGNLEDESFLLPKHDCSYKMQFEQMLTEEKMKSVTIMDFNSIEAIKKCVSKGLGLTVLPEIAVKKEIHRKQLSIIPWAGDIMETAVLMIWHRDKWISPTLQAFMDLSRSDFKLS